MHKQIMKRATTLLLLMAAVLMCMQCGHGGYHPQLVLLDSLADRNADSAVSLMHRIEPMMAEADERNRRYFELLSIKVADKADLLLPTDTAAWQLVEWYEQHGDRHLLPMAYYYAARICRTRNDSPQALDYLLKARDLLSDDDSQLHLKAVVNSQMGYIFWLQKLYGNALESFKQAFYCDNVLKDTLGMIYNQKDIANTYENLGKRDSCVCFMRKAFALAQKYKDETMITEIGIQMANVYFRNGLYDDALKEIQKNRNYDEKQKTAFYSIKADIYHKLGQSDSATLYLTKLISQNQVYAKEHGYRILSDYAFENHCYDSAYSYFKKYRLFSDSVARVTTTNIVAQMYALYNYHQKERESALLKQENEANKKILSFIGIFVLFSFLIIVIASLYVRGRNMTLRVKLERRKRIEAALEVASIHQDEHSAKQSLIANSDIVKAIRLKLNDTQDTNKVLSDKDWEELGQTIERQYPGFKNQVAEVIKLTPFKLNACLLLKAGFSNADISRLTQHSVEAVTSARRRMAQAAFGKKCTPSDWDSFINMI